jgi:hypothetical protein
MDPTTTSDEQVRPARRGRLTSLLWLAVLAGSLALQVWFPRVDSKPLNDTYNVDVGGRNAFYQFARRRAPYAARNHESLVGLLEDYDTDATLCLLGPARYPTPREWKALLDWVGSGGHLLLAARWEAAEVTIPGVDAHVKSTKPPEPRPFESRRRRKDRAPESKKSDAGEAPAGEAEQPEVSDSTKPASDSKSPPGPTWTSLLKDAHFAWKTDGAIEASGAEVLVKTGESTQAVRLGYGNGTIVLTASDFIFSNAALYDRGRQNGLLAVKLLEAAGAPDDVLFDESLNATGTPKVVGVLLDPLLRPATVQLFVLLVLFGWAGTRRFGGLLPTAAPARHDVADHTNSLGNLYYKAHHSKGVLREYLEQLRTDLRLRYFKGHEQRVLQPVARRAGLEIDDVKRLLADAEAAVARPRLSRREAAGFIRRLSRLRPGSDAEV